MKKDTMTINKINSVVMTIKVSKFLTWRLKIGILLIRFASFVMGFKSELIEVD